MEEVIIEYTRKTLADNLFDTVEEIFNRIQALLGQFETLILTAQEVFKIAKQVFDYIIDSIVGYREQLKAV